MVDVSSYLLIELLNYCFKMRLTCVLILASDATKMVKVLVGIGR